MGRPKTAGIGLYEPREDFAKIRTVKSMLESIQSMIQARVASLEERVRVSGGIPDDETAQELLRLARGLVALERDTNRPMEALPGAETGDVDAPAPPDPLKQMSEADLQRALRKAGA